MVWDLWKGLNEEVEVEVVEEEELKGLEGLRGVVVVVVVRLSEEDMREYLSGSRSGLLERGMCMRGVLGIVGGYEDGDGDGDNDGDGNGGVEKRNHFNYVVLLLEKEGNEGKGRLNV